MNDENNTPDDSPEVYPLDETALEMLADLDRQGQALNAAINTTLTYFAKQHKLGDGWQLAPNRRELVRKRGPRVTNMANTLSTGDGNVN